MENRQLRENILDELDFDPSIDAANVGVAVDNGVVTLSGHLLSYAQKLAAEDAVRQVRGVRAIANEIEVRYPSNKKTSDDEIAKRALKILEWYEVVSGDVIQVVVERGWVTLTGSVPWQYQKQSAEAAIRKLNGIVGVSNKISIKSTVSSHDIKKEIEKALRRRTETETQGIMVSIKDGNRVVLEGKVDNWSERTAVESAAWSVPGVHSVEDHLIVSP